jgi:valyl-tRNA synthetase
MHNNRDWCISRQLWLGHAIPVSTCGNGHQFAWVDPPEHCPTCGSTRLSNDPDVLDTWFSSSLWPFAIFGWPEHTADLQHFYPTDALVTARDIIFLWVARMIMMGLRFTDRIPFHDVIITSTIQAADGSRMTKSRGNVIDPLDMIETYGADAVRAWAAAVGTGGQDVRFSEERIESYKRFANKLWNVTRFLVARLGGGDEVIPAVPAPAPQALEPEDRWMLAKLAALVPECEAGFESFRFHDVMERLYDLTWHSFCDWYVEMAKLRFQERADESSRQSAAWTAVTTLDTILRLLHPFMPFVTEECAQHLPSAAESLQRRSWPAVEPLYVEPSTVAAHEEVNSLVDLVQQIRALRQDAGAPAKRDAIQVVVRSHARTLSAAQAARLLEGLTPATVLDAHVDGLPHTTVESGPFRADVVISGKMVA